LDPAPQWVYVSGTVLWIRIRIWNGTRIILVTWIRIKQKSASALNKNHNLDPHQGDKSNPDPHQGGADPQHWKKQFTETIFFNEPETQFAYIRSVSFRILPYGS
jgi:hypothetical protein